MKSILCWRERGLCYFSQAHDPLEVSIHDYQVGTPNAIMEMPFRCCNDNILSDMVNCGVINITQRSRKEMIS